MRDGRFDETVQRDLLRFAQAVEPIDVQRVAQSLARIAAEFDAARRNADVGTRGEQLGLSFEAARQHLVVGIHAGDEPAARRGEPRVQRGHDAAVRHGEDAQPLVARGCGERGSRRAVRRTVVDEDELEIR